MDGLKVSGPKQYFEPGKSLTEVQGGGNLSLKGAGASGESFADTLNKAIQKVDHLHKVADTKMEKLATGESKNIADVMVAAEKADIAFKMMVQVRNKIINAYNEIMKMQV